MADQQNNKKDIIYPASMDELKQYMLSGEQSIGVNYYQHGEQVAQQFIALMNLLKTGEAQTKIDHSSPRRRWVLPKWIVNHQQWIYNKLVSQMDQYYIYHVWHDCGKPLIKQLDAQQAVHYPDHALVSSKAWLAAGGNNYIATLIENDMVPHHLRSVDEAQQLAKNDPHFLGLMVTAVCSLHVCSPSTKEGDTCPLDLTTTAGFKIKMKRIAFYGKWMMRILHPTEKI